MGSRVSWPRWRATGPPSWAACARSCRTWTRAALTTARCEECPGRCGVGREKLRVLVGFQEDLVGVI